MLRRACSACLLLAFSLQMAASLYACHPRRTGAHRVVAEPHRAPEAQEQATAAAVAHSAHHSPAADASPPAGAHVCDRRHAGPCPHAGASLHPCRDDPAAGLQVTGDGGVPRSVEALALGAGTSPLHRPRGTEGPPGPAPAPERPPPRV